jgi:tetratricopeptide (TPR) repeat protein
MQVWIETGTLGMLTYLGILLLFIWTSIKNLKAYYYDKETFLSQVGIFTAALALILHSFIDFDLSLSGITIVLWSLFGLTSVLYRDRGKDSGNNKISNSSIGEGGRNIVINHVINTKVSFSYLMIPAILALFTTFTFNVASGYSARGVNLIKEKKYNEAKEAFGNAISFDSFQASYKLDYGNIMYNILNNEEKRNATLVLEAKKQVDEAIKKDKFNSILNARAGAFYFQIGDIDTGLRLIDESVRLQPLRAENYQQMADAYIKGADAYMKMGKKDEARVTLSKAVDIEVRVEQINSIKMKPVELNAETKEMINKAKEMLREL